MLLWIAQGTGCGSKVSTPVPDHLACVSGVVLSGGQPATGARVSASTGGSVIADLTGHYALRLPPDSTLQLRVRLAAADSAFYFDSAAIHTGSPDGPCSTRDFALPGPPTSGVCVQGTVHFNFTPVPGAVVTTADGRGSISDPSGHYRLELGPADLAILHAEGTASGQSLRATAACALPRSAGCAMLDLSLCPDTTLYHVEAVLQSEGRGNAAPGRARCTVWNEQTRQPVPGARFTLFSVDSTYVLDLAPTGVPGEYEVAGDFTGGGPIGILYPSGRFTLGVDVDGDGTNEAAAAVDAPAWAVILTPPQSSIRPASFDVAWKVAHGADTAFYAVMVKGPSGTASESRLPAPGSHFLRLQGIGAGRHVLQLLASLGGGLHAAPPNLSGHRIFGHFWSEFHGPDIFITVVSGNGGAP